MNFPTRHPNLNTLWSSLILEELWRLGIRDCCIAPGSRSAPLTLAAASHAGVRKHIHFDERGLGFFALGIARQSRRPVAIITTSGTAVANLYPAIIEARQSGVPLVVITADRPPELIDCGANQAIDQQAIYGRYPGAVLELPTPAKELPLSWVLTSLDQAFARSCQQKLPLHINCMFREPLYPKGNTQDYSDLMESCSRWLPSNRPYTVYPLPSEGVIRGDSSFLQEFVQGQGILVVGRVDPGIDSEVILSLARALGWPILADVQSQLHGHPATLPHVDLILASEKGKTLMAKADRVLQVGSHFVSKRLTRLVERNWHYYVMLGEGNRRLDTGHCQTHRLPGAIDTSCESLTRQVICMKGEIKASCNDWADALSDLGLTIAESVRTQVGNDTELTESWIGANLGHFLPDDCGLFLGNSLPVRLVDIFSTAHTGHVFTNRGASGIDGVLASAAGCAVARKGPLALLIGDLSFLHDLNSLALAKKSGHPMVIILLNNDGGGIFSMLPLSGVAEQAETYFQTPHGLDARGAATMFGISYSAPTSCPQFRDQLNAAFRQPGCSIIEVKTAPGQAAAHIGQVVKAVEAI
ncbi:2-succinyl-5-enolpyruvyl-6-hydroxy-3-cyclohexene-1-carboxylic-acid synthase [Endozoicomonas sp. Mp262]|uniref:2-succinyl-5-enolpyruvyl-6-hydroxy-3- cyclohexene-1-carboxylic-acid synthase n=1 Tax=Endozoicomonas sp. Mp262 TaxID=2919499 RepID=UPI0021DB25E8